MILFPAIDLYEKKAVRLYKGDYRQLTVYSEHPEEIAADFRAQGCTHIHMVDLEGARDGTMPNLSVVERVASQTGLFVELGGGIRTREAVERCFAAGVSRVILGTAAVTDPAFLEKTVADYGDRIAVGADVRDGMVAIKGWLEQTPYTLDSFLCRMQDCGVSYVICTDISRDGAMRGTNLSLYGTLSRRYALHLTASGGVSSLEDVRALRQLDLYGAIVGKAYYTGALSLREAVEVAK